MHCIHPIRWCHARILGKYTINIMLETRQSRSTAAHISSPRLSTCHCWPVYGISLHVHVCRTEIHFGLYEKQDKANKLRIQEKQQITTFVVKDFPQRHDICAFIYCLTLPPHNTTRAHTHRSTSFLLYLSEFPLDFVLPCWKARRSFIWCRNVLSPQSWRCCRVRIRSAAPSISHYDKETFVQWGSLELRPTSSTCSPHRHAAWGWL